MDSFASLALATEPPNPILLKDKPYGRDEHIITRKMVKHIIGQSIFQIIVIIVFIVLDSRYLCLLVSNGCLNMKISLINKKGSFNLINTIWITYLNLKLLSIN